jgi:hypothetical protein
MSVLLPIYEAAPEKALRRHKFLPIYLHALFSPLLSPSHQHLFGSRLSRALYEFHTPPQGLLYPILALVLSPVAAVQPQVREAAKLRIRSPQ